MPRHEANTVVNSYDRQYQSHDVGRKEIEYQTNDCEDSRTPIVNDCPL
jgi:hypothetical protein